MNLSFKYKLSILIKININYVINQIFLTLFIIIRVAFYTLIERKFLSYTQNRKGPNKIRTIGLIQPLTDAIKLLTKKEFKLTYSNIIFF